MKICILCLFALYTATAYSQNEMPTRDGNVFYESVDSTVKGSSLELYKRAKLWFVDAFRDSKSVIREDDKDESLVVGKGSFTFYQGMIVYKIRFTIKIQAKDNRYRAQVYDVIILSGTKEMESAAETLNKRKNFDKIKNKINEGVEKMLLELSAAMSKKADNDF